MGRPVGTRFRQMVRKNSGLVSFAPESRLPFVQIKSVRFTGKRPRRAETGIKLKAWKKWNANFRLEYSVRKNRTTFSDVPLLPEIFCWNDPKIHFLALLVHSLLFTVSYFISSWITSKPSTVPFFSLFSFFLFGRPPKETPSFKDGLVFFSSRKNRTLVSSARAKDMRAC